MTLLERAAAGLPPSLVPLTVDQYHKMIDAGILDEGASIELIDGLLVQKDRADLDPNSDLARRLKASGHMSFLERAAAGLPPELVRLTVDQYHQMLEAGVLREGAPIELIDGLLVQKDRADLGGDPVTIGTRHVFSVKRLVRLFLRVEEVGCHLHSQAPVALGNDQEPEPDLAVVHGAEMDYADRYPEPADIPAIMEVSDSSLTFDRRTKLEIYATAGIPIYWIVNLVDNQIEVHEQPEGSTYTQRTVYGLDETVTLVLPGLKIDVKVADVIPVV